MQVLGGVAHDQRAGIDELVGEEARVGVDAFTHRVAAHVLDATGDDDVVLAEADARSGGGHRGHRACAHAVDGEAGDAAGESGEQCGRTSDGQALVTGLRSRGDRDLVDPFGREVGVLAKQFADCLDDEVVCASVGVHALGACLAERGTDAVDEDNIPL